MRVSVLFYAEAEVGDGSHMTTDLFKKNRLGRALSDNIDATGDCWIWQGALHTFGYGTTWKNNTTALVHRVVWEALVGPIPDGLTLDHLCRNPPCCNPDHLEPVSLAENLRRGYSPSARNTRATHCPLGHPLSGSNLYVCSQGKRSCIACMREATRRWRIRKKLRNE